MDSTHGALIAELSSSSKSMTLQSSPDLIALLSRRDWTVLDANTRFTALHAINDAITRLRVNAGLPEFDDLGCRAAQTIERLPNRKSHPLPDEPPPPRAAPPGAHTGSNNTQPDKG